MCESSIARPPCDVHQANQKGDVFPPEYHASIFDFLRSREEVFGKFFAVIVTAVGSIGYAATKEKLWTWLAVVLSNLILAMGSTFAMLLSYNYRYLQMCLSKVEAMSHIHRFLPTKWNLLLRPNRLTWRNFPPDVFRYFVVTMTCFLLGISAFGWWYVSNEGANIGRPRLVIFLSALIYIIAVGWSWFKRNKKYSGLLDEVIDEYNSISTSPTPPRTIKLSGYEAFLELGRRHRVAKKRQKSKWLPYLSVNLLEMNLRYRPLLEWMETLSPDTITKLKAYTECNYDAYQTRWKNNIFQKIFRYGPGISLAGVVLHKLKRLNMPSIEPIGNMMIGAGLTGWLIGLILLWYIGIDVEEIRSLVRVATSEFQPPAPPTTPPAA